MKDILRNQSLDLILQRQQTTSPDQKILPVILDALGEAYDAGLYRSRHHHPAYTQIHLVGQRDHYAKLTRKIGTRWIQVEVLTPQLELDSAVPADNPAEQWIGAYHVRAELQGDRASYAGTDAYYQAFRHLADPSNGYQA